MRVLTLIIFLIVACKSDPDSRKNLYDFVVENKTLTLFDLQGDYPGCSGVSDIKMNTFKMYLSKIKVSESDVNYNEDETRKLVFYIDFEFDNKEVRIRICNDHMCFMDDLKKTYRLSKESELLLKELYDKICALEVEASKKRQRQ